jgi:hypothetical protein
MPAPHIRVRLLEPRLTSRIELESVAAPYAEKFRSASKFIFASRLATSAFVLRFHSVKGEGKLNGGIMGKMMQRAILVLVFGLTASAFTFAQDNGRDINRDRRDIYRDRGDLRGDYAKLQRDEVNHNWRAVQRDRADIYRDRADLRRDYADIREDRHEHYRDQDGWWRDRDGRWRRDWR